MSEMQKTDREKTQEAYSKARHSCDYSGGRIGKGTLLSIGNTTVFERNRFSYKNQELADAIFETGLNPTWFCKISNIPPREVNAFLNDQLPPLVGFGEGRRIVTWSSPAQYLATALDMNPEDLFVKYAGFITGNPRSGAMAQHDDRDQVEFHEIQSRIRSVLRTLTWAERDVLERRFGIGRYAPQTYAEIADFANYTREGIRQIEYRALRKLRHLSRSKFLRDFVFVKECA